jgi:mannose/fructose/N-acetylgalactosamine-specific phosphotransferase system component IID
MGEQALARQEEYSSEDLYRSFFRYALDLLFEHKSGYRIGFGWAMCPVCDQMFGENAEGKPSAGTRCAEHLNKTCPGILRPIEWADLRTEK